MTITIDDASKPLVVQAGGTTIMTPANLLTLDSNYQDTQITYTVTTPPSDGTLLDNGVPASTFTQADIDDELVSYHETASYSQSANSFVDDFIFTVSDPAGNQIANTQIQIDMITSDDFLSSGAQNFATVSNWSSGSVPDDTKDVYIAPAGAATVTSNANETINSIGTGSGDTLDIDGGQVTVSNGSGPNANNGTIDVQGGASLSFEGPTTFYSTTPFNNVGTLEVQNGGSVAVGTEIIGTGAVDIGADGDLSVDATIAGNVQFTGPGAVLDMGYNAATEIPGQISGQIIGAEDTDQIWFPVVTYSSLLQVVWQENATGTGGTLSLNNSGTGATEATLNLAGQYTSSDFVAAGSAPGVPLSPHSPPNYTIITVVGPNPTSPVNADEWILSDGQWRASIEPGSHPAGYNTMLGGDFTGGGTDGILWYDSSTGDTDEWELSNGTWAKSVDLGAHSGNYQIAGVGDFTGDGTDDVLWTSPGNGQVQTDIWELSNGQRAASVSPGSHPAGYLVAGIGDWTGDGTDGVLWYNASTGDTDEWQLTNGQWSASVDLGSHPGNYQIVGIGDLFGNGRDDVLWTSVNSDGTVATDIWELGSNGQWIASVSPGSHPAGYQVVGIGDFAGNGTSDILWQNSTTGDVDEWLIKNGQWAGSIDLGTHPGNFQIAATGDFTGSGTSGILWHS